jgi:F0F1-type ATP synthase assembly protein I
VSAANAKRPRRSWTQLAWNAGASERAVRQHEGQSQSDREEILLAKGTGYSIFSYLIAGMLAYGGIGWVIGHFTHIGMLFPIGMLVGLAISLGWIIYRYGVKGGGQ